MKTKTIVLILSTVLSLNFAKAGEELNLPTITKPELLKEGTERQLTDAQISELIPWARDSKLFLTDLLDSIQGLSTQEKIERLDFGLKQVVNDSSTKQTELLMRYILNRALVVKDILNDEMISSAVGTEDTKLRSLVASIKMAIKYYDIDMNSLSEKSIPDFQSFGEEYFDFLSELNKSIFDASAQYKIQRTSFEWLQWDLYRDLENARHAPKIIKINNALKMAPTSKMSDAQYIKNIKQLKRVADQLKITINTKTVLNQNNVSEITENQTKTMKIETGENYFYSTSTYKCYNKNSHGDVMYSSPVSNSLCAKENSYHYNTTSFMCYKKSKAGDVMYADVVSNSYCTKYNEYSYNTSSYKCYKKSLWGDVMYTEVVSNSMCAKPDSYVYNSNTYKCYKKSLWNDVMYTEVVSDSYCK